MTEEKNNQTGMLAMMDSEDQNSESLSKETILTLKDIEKLKLMGQSEDVTNRNLLFAYLNEVQTKGNELALLILYKSFQHHIAVNDIESNCPKFVKFLSSFNIENYKKNKIIVYDDIANIFLQYKNKGVDVESKLPIYIKGYSDWAEEIILLTIPEVKQQSTSISVDIHPTKGGESLNEVIPEKYPVYSKSKKELNYSDILDIKMRAKHTFGLSKSNKEELYKTLEEFSKFSDNKVVLAVIHKTLTQVVVSEINNERSGLKYDLDHKSLVLNCPSMHKLLSSLSIENYSKNNLFTYRDLMYFYEKTSNAPEPMWDILKPAYSDYCELNIKQGLESISQNLTVKVNLS